MMGKTSSFCTNLKADTLQICKKKLNAGLESHEKYKAPQGLNVHTRRLGSLKLSSKCLSPEKHSDNTDTQFSLPLPSRRGVRKKAGPLQWY